MLKKVLIALGLVLLLTGILVGTMLPATAAESKYQVGYARVDVNPYVEDGNFSSGIMALPLRGTGDVWNRLSQKMVDDNGDGVIDANDGLKATCVAITDENHKTILLINIDLLGSDLLNKVNTAIMERVNAAIACGEISNVDLAKEGIYYGATHTHNAPDTSAYTSAGKTGTNVAGVSLKEVNENLGIWIDRTVEDVADAAIIALKDRAAATITRDQLSVSDATDPVVKGKSMVTTRHLVNGEDGSIAGDNFNDRGNDPTQITEADDTMYLLKFNFTDSSKLPIIFTGWRGHPSLNNINTYENGGTTCLSSDYVNAYRHALEFGVDVTLDTDYGVGHVASWELGNTQKYRVIFFNGTGGNTNPRNFELQRDENGNVLTYESGSKTVKGYTWIDVSASEAKIKGRACSYGVVLATLAQECLIDSKNASSVSYGEIKTLRKSFTTDRKTLGVTQLGYNAAVSYWEADALYDAALAAYNTADTKFSTYKTAYNKYTSAGVMGFLYKSKMESALNEYNTANATLTTALADYTEYMTAHTNNTAVQESTATVNGTKGPTKPLQQHPFLYKEEGEVYPIGSLFHATAIQGDWNNKLNIPKTTGSSITLNAIMVGEELAFVAIPGEPFDYYYKETGIYTPQNNLWNILNGSTYGKPIVLGYTNGNAGYFPNYDAYYYNQGSTTKVMGSYESQTSGFAPGTGEKMVRELYAMLAALNGEGRVAYCEHCRRDVAWTPFTGQTLETGHYYLCSDLEVAQSLVDDGRTVCFDLNGYTLTGTSRAFYYNSTATNGKATLSIMDSSAAGTGVVQGCGGAMGAGRGFGGGTIFQGVGHELNIYGGTITNYEKAEYSTLSGNILMIRGTLNMYGGEITGGLASVFQGSYYYNSKVVTANYEGQGGNIDLCGTLNMYGGKVTGGATQKIIGEVIGSDTLGYATVLTVEECEGSSPCVCVSAFSNNKGKVNLYADASIDHVYFKNLDETCFNVYGNYTGTTQVQFSNKTGLTLGSLVGNAKADAYGVAANASRANLTVTDVNDLYIAVSGNNLVLAEHPWTYRYCQGCAKTVQWKPMGNSEFNQYNNATYGTTKMPAGHYIMDEDVYTEQKQLNANGDLPGTFCFDLAGHTFTGKTRAFYAYDDTVLNIQDSVGGGILSGKSGSAMGGGVVYLQGNTIFNLYGGTIRHNNEVADHILHGGCVRIYGATFRMHGGTLEGLNVTEYGGAIYATPARGVPSKIEIFGGIVKGAKANIAGDCIYLADKCTIVLAGDPTVDDIYFVGDPANALTVDTTAVAFAGSVQLTCATAPAQGTDLGICKGTEGITGNVTLTGSALPVIVVDGKLTTKMELKSFHLVDSNGIYATFDTFAEALTAYTYQSEQGNYIQITKDVSGADINKTVVVDLNGSYLSSPTIENGVTLYAMDSQTDDFTIDDEMAYGMVYNPTVVGSGVVLGVSADSNVSEDGYLMLAEGMGYSFHRVNLKIKSMSLRTGAVGVYYSCDFMGDEIVAENVKCFGIALSVAGDPDANNLDTQCAYTASEGFVSGSGGNAGCGVLLKDIMKTTNTTEKNYANAQTDVYGRAYIETVDGDYVFGNAVVRDLRQLVEQIDTIFDSLTESQRANITQFYNTYADVMEDWNISNICG